MNMIADAIVSIPISDIWFVVKAVLQWALAPAILSLAFMVVICVATGWEPGETGVSIMFFSGIAIIWLAMLTLKGHIVWT